MKGFVAIFVILYFTSKLSISYEEGTLWIWFCCIVYLFCLFQPVGGCLWHHFCHWVLQLGFLVFWRGWVAILTMRFSVHFKYKWGCLKKQYPKKKKKNEVWFKKVIFWKGAIWKCVIKQTSLLGKKVQLYLENFVDYLKKNYYSIFCNEIKLNQTFPLPFVLILKLLAIAGFCLHFFFFFFGIIKY